MCIQVQETAERISVEKLQARDRIHFYTDLLLFEDELHDNGCSILTVKVVNTIFITNSNIIVSVAVKAREL